MSSRRLFSRRRRSVQSPLPPSNDSSPNGASTSTARPTIATAPQAVYPDYLNDTTGRGWDATLVISSILRDISALPPALSDPFTQVFDVVSEVIEAIKTMRDGRDGCAQLMVRVTRFLETLVDGLKGKNIDDREIASSLRILRRNLMAIHADARQWSRLNLVKRYLQRDKIMKAISMHGENLTDCLQTFQIVTLMTASGLPDRMERTRFPGPPVSARPVAASENTVGSILAAGLHDFFERPAGHAVFEQIGVAMQGRLEEMGLRPTSAPVGSRRNRHAEITGLRASYRHHVSYLRSQIWELMVEVRRVLPHISVRTDIEGRVVGWKTRWKWTGDRTHQRRETVMATWKLLNELHNVGEIEFDLAMLAGKMDDLSMSLDDLGLWDEAFEVQAMVVVLYRAGGDKSYLSVALAGSSIRPSKFGRHEEALRASEEALSVHRPLPGDPPEVFDRCLAHSFLDLSDDLAKFGRHEEALRAREEGLSIRRSLPVDRPEVFRRYLAHSFINLSVNLAKFGRHEEAVEASEEALSIWRSLATDRPEVFRPDLAGSLSNLSNCLSKFGRDEEALKANEEALNIWRSLATDRPEVFRPDLAHSLNNLSVHLLKFGCDEEALKAMEEASSIYRLLAADCPKVFRPDLARSLTNTSNHLAKFGRHEEALKGNEEASSIFRLLAGDCPKVFLPNLAHSLNKRSIHLSKFGRDEEALKANEEALSIYRSVAADHPDIFHLDLADSLNYHSDYLSKFGRDEEALKATQEALEICHSLATD